MKPVLLILFALLASQAQARTWNIKVDGSGDAHTIQAGIDSSSTGDTVLVSSGTYLENLRFDRDVVLLGEQGSELAIIDGSGAGETVVFFGPSTTRKSILDGFRITGGAGSSRHFARPRGGGIYIWGGSPTIRNNLIIGNRAERSLGGGIFVGSLDFSQHPEPLIENNVVAENLALLGGGLSLNRGSPILRGNIIRNNLSITDGGGIFVWLNLDHVRIENNQFWDNEAGDHGGAIASWNAQTLGGEGRVDITFNLFVRNVARAEEPLITGAGGALHIWGLKGSIINNTIVYNRSSMECEGGGIAMNDLTGWIIQKNVIALNSPDGLSCRESDMSSFSDNLLFGNGLDLGCADAVCAVDGSNLLVDPWFCDPESDDFSLAENSPALGMGASPNPGCGPVDRKPTTWGQIKARYGD